MLDQLVLYGVLVLIGGLMYYLPVMKGPDAFFGIPVSEEFYRGPEARTYLRVYRLLTAGLVAGAIACLRLAPDLVLATPGRLVGVMLTVIFAPMAAVVVIWRRVRPYEVKPTRAEGGGEAPPGSKWRYVSPWVEVLLGAVLLMLVALTVWRYPRLPWRIPIHWNAAGQADGWSAKSPFPLAALLGLLGFLQVMLLTVLMGLAQARVRLPELRVQEYREAHERYMRLWARGMNALRLGVTLMLGGILWASLFGVEQQAAGATPPGMILVWVGTAGLLLTIVWLIARGLALRREMREIAGPGSLESTAPTDGWIGGLIYCNRSDPALRVEKRVGIGWTLNFAHPLAWVLMGLALAVPIGVAVLMLLGVLK